MNKIRLSIGTCKQGKAAEVKIGTYGGYHDGQKRRAMFREAHASSSIFLPSSAHGW